MRCESLDVGKGIDAAYVGPPLTAGPLPALFYFSLSARDSLCLDPYNQVVVYLSSYPVRIFSLTLPGHEGHLPPTEALNVWAQGVASGHNVIAACVDQIEKAVDALLKEGVLLPEKIAAAGLSRGAFIAAHAASRIPYFRTILGFAPLTRLSCTKEFQEIADSPSVEALSLENLSEALCDRTVRFYIGNLDTKVSTRYCFDFIEKLSQDASLKKRIRSPKIELIISPSIGYMGHGTSKEIFERGGQWIAEQLGL